MSSQELEKALAQVLGNPPVGTNPYSYLSKKLQENLLPQVGASVLHQLYFLAGLIGLSGIFVLVSLFLRWRKGVFWVVRYQRNLSLLRPHASISWSLFAVVAVILLEALIACDILLFKGRPRLDTGYWQFTAWCSLWVTGSIATWSISASHLVHLHTRGHDVQRWAQVSNIVGIGAPVVYLACLLSIGLVGGHEYKVVLEGYNEIQSQLQTAASTYSPNDPISPSSLQSSYFVFLKILHHIDRLGVYARATYIFDTVWTAILVAVLLSAGIQYLVSLRRTIGQSHALLVNSSFDRNSVDRRVQRTLNSITVTLVAFTLLAFGCMAFSIFGIVHPLALNRSSVATILAIVPLWLFGLLGFPCSVILVRGAWDARESDQQIAKKSSIDHPNHPPPFELRSPRLATTTTLPVSSSPASSTLTPSRIRWPVRKSEENRRTVSTVLSGVGGFGSRAGGGGGAGGEEDFETSAIGSVLVTVDVHVSEEVDSKEKESSSDEEKLEIV